MEGRQISDDQWQQIEGILPGRPGSVGVTARDNRLFVDGVLWVLRSGAEWKDLPEEYGKTVHKRYTRWARSGIWKKVFQVLLDDPDNQYVMIDSTLRVKRLFGHGKVRYRGLRRTRNGWPNGIANWPAGLCHIPMALPRMQTPGQDAG